MNTDGYAVFTEGKEGKEGVTRRGGIPAARVGVIRRALCAGNAEGRIHSPRLGLCAERCWVERETGAGKPRVRWGAPLPWGAYRFRHAFQAGGTQFALQSCVVLIACVN